MIKLFCHNKTIITQGETTATKNLLVFVQQLNTTAHLAAEEQPANNKCGRPLVICKAPSNCYIEH